MGGKTERREDFLKKRYPRSVKLKDESIVKVRPIEAKDEKLLTEFFNRLPLSERRLLKDDVTRPGVIRTWCQNINLDAVLPLLAFDGERIVGDATLHREKRGWMNHVAQVRVSVDPDARGRGLATQLIRELVEIAPRYDIYILDAECLDEQPGAMKVFEDLNFINVATLPQHALDLSRKPHDLHIYSLNVQPPEKLAVDPDEDPERVDVGEGG
jgi:RimJ/RimL family protein N-acetyltransferase